MVEIDRFIHQLSLALCSSYLSQLWFRNAQLFLLGLGAWMEGSPTTDCLLRIYWAQSIITHSNTSQCHTLWGWCQLGVFFFFKIYNWECLRTSDVEQWCYKCGPRPAAPTAPRKMHQRQTFLQPPGSTDVPYRWFWSPQQFKENPTVYNTGRNDIAIFSHQYFTSIITRQEGPC